MNIEGRHVTLRAIEADDLPLLNRWANDPAIQELLAGWHFPTSMKDQAEWAGGLSCNSLNQRFAVHAPELGLIGTANLVNINWKDRNAFHGMMLGDKAIQGKGYGVDVIMAVMRYAFDELGLKRLDGAMVGYNDRSVHVYCNKCGWKHEGVARDAFYRRGRWWDKLLVGVTERDYRELLERNDYWARGPVAVAA